MHPSTLNTPRLGDDGDDWEEEEERGEEDSPFTTAPSSPTTNPSTAIADGGVKKPKKTRKTLREINAAIAARMLKFTSENEVATATVVHVRAEMQGVLASMRRLAQVDPALAFLFKTKK